MVCTAAAAAAALPGGGGGDNDPDKRKKIIAAIISILISCGAIVLVAVSGGAATPGLILAQHILINAGNSGLEYTLEKDFSWSKWASVTAKAAFTTLITFYGGSVGQYVGLQLRDSSLTEWKIKAISAAAGALVGAICHGFTFVLVCKYRGDQMKPFELCKEMGTGAFNGAKAGFLAIKTSPKNAESATVGSISYDEDITVDIEIVHNNSRAHEIQKVILEIQTDLVKRAAMRT